MRNLLIAGATALGALSAGACSGCSVLSSDRGVLSATLLDEKALYAAEAAEFGAESAADAAVDAGLLHGPPAAQTSAYLDEAHAALGAARVAYAAGDAATCAERIAAVQSLIAQAWALIPTQTKD